MKNPHSHREPFRKTGSADNRPKSGKDALLLTLIILPFFILSFFCNPQGDDFWISALVRKSGFFPALHLLYDTVTARYTALTMMSFNPLRFGNFWIYRLIPFAFILAFYFTTAALLKALTAGRDKPGSIYLLAAAFTTAYVVSLPGLGEGLYWLSSLVVYQMGILFLIAWFTCVVSMHSGRAGFGKQLYCFIIFFLLLGFNEPLTLLACGANFFIFLFRLKRKQSFYQPLAAGVISIPVLFFLFAAPSFNHRYVSVSTTGVPAVFTSLFYSCKLVGYHLLRILFNPFVLISLCIAAKTMAGFSGMPVKSWSSVRRLWIVFLFAGTGIAWGSSFFSKDVVVPLRISNLIAFLFLAVLFFTLWVATAHDMFRIRERIAFFRSRTGAALIVGLYLLGWITPNNFRLAIGDLFSGRAAAYNAELQQRFELLRTVSSDTCVLPVLKNRPISLRYSTFDNDRHIGEYFGKTVIYEDR